MIGALPDGSGPVALSTALAELEEHLLARGESVRRLTTAELEGYRIRNAIAGWRLDLYADEAGKRRVDLLVDSSFPYALPMLMLVDRPGVNEWPHLEADGKMCLWPSEASLQGQPIGVVVDEALWASCQLIDAGAAGTNADDLRSEFLSYWAQAVPVENRPLFSVVIPAGPSRAVYAWHLSRFTVVGESEEGLRTWISHYGFKPERGQKPVPAVFAWLPAPMLPKEYPARTTELLSLLRQQAASACVLIEKAAAAGPNSVVVLLGASAPNGPCLAGALLQKGKSAVLPSGRTPDRATRGFRHGRVPPEVVRRSWLGSARLERALVHRMDPNWVHGRGRDARAAILRAKRVAVLGCGSLGSPLALNLARAGVGDMLMVDAQNMSGANVGRHELGAPSVGESKAEELAAALARRFPHLGSVRAVPSRWQVSMAKQPDLLDGCDLIVSAMGAWDAEGPLNAWHLACGRVIPIIYVWAEAHACAGHAVLVDARGGCFACGLDRSGTPVLEVTRWEQGATTIAEPACGAWFSPYGPVELSYISNMGTELAVDVLLGEAPEGAHRVWATRHQHLESAGGNWTDEWISDDARRQAGGLLVDLTWPNGPCAECGRTRS